MKTSKFLFAILIALLIASCGNPAKKQINLILDAYEQKVSTFSPQIEAINGDNLDSISQLYSNFSIQLKDTLNPLKNEIISAIKEAKMKEKEQAEILSRFADIQCKVSDLYMLLAKKHKEIAYKHLEIAKQKIEESEKISESLPPMLKSVALQGVPEQKSRIEADMKSIQIELLQMPNQLDSLKKALKENPAKLLEDSI